MKGLKAHCGLWKVPSEEARGIGASLLLVPPYWIAAGFAGLELTQQHGAKLKPDKS